MEFELKLNDEYMTILCPKSLEDFSKEFINISKEKIDRIKSLFHITEQTQLIVALTDNEELANFMYGKSDFSGFFTDTGAFAYINLNGEKSKEYMFKGLLHNSLDHYLKVHIITN